MLKNTPTISVIIPTYNRPGTLARAVKSALAQALTKEEDAVEVLVVNDGGQDVSAILAALGDTRVRSLALPERRGPSAARNLGLGEARGRFLAFLDDDDFLDPAHFTGLLHALRASGAGLAYSGAFVLRERRTDRGAESDGRPVMALANPFDPVEMQSRNLFPIHAALVDRAVIDKTGGFDETLDAFEDYDLWLRALRQTEFAHVPARTCWYVKGADRQNLSDDVRRMHAALVRVYAANPPAAGSRAQEAAIQAARADALRRFEKRVLQSVLAGEVARFRELDERFRPVPGCPPLRWKISDSMAQ